MLCTRSERQETLSMTTTTFATFPRHPYFPPVHPTPTAANSFNLFRVHKHVVQVLTCPSQPFIASFLRLSPPFPQTEGRVHNPADFKMGLHLFVGGVENYFFSRLRPRRQRRVRSGLSRFTIRSRRALKYNGFSLMSPLMTALRLL